MLSIINHKQQELSTYIETAMVIFLISWNILRMTIFSFLLLKYELQNNGNL
jgi:hypothetical protein